MTRDDEQFDAASDAEFRELDADLRLAMRAPAPPTELVERIELACGFADLNTALRVPTPAGLTDRIHGHTARRLRRPVLARIGPLLAAAAVLIAAALGVWMMTDADRPAVAMVSIEEEIEQFAYEMDRAAASPTELEVEIAALDVELDQIALADVEEEGLDDGWGEDTRDLSDDLLLMEAELDAF